MYLTNIIVMLHYIPVDRQGEYSINREYSIKREGLLTNELAVISIGIV